MTPQPGFFRANARWLAAALLLTFSSSYGQTFFISLFAGQIREDFGLSHGVWGALYGAATLFSAALMIWAGALTDRYRARNLGTLAMLLLAAACCLMAVAATPWTLALALLAAVIAVTETTNSLGVALLAILAVAAQAAAVVAWAQKSGFAIAVDTGYALAAGVVMILAHALL